MDIEYIYTITYLQIPFLEYKLHDCKYINL